MLEQTQSVDLLIDKYISENNVQTEYDKQKPAFLDTVIDDYLKKSGYEIPGEIPKERPAPYPEGTYPGLTPPPKGTYIETVRGPAERERMAKEGMTAGWDDWLPKLPFWQQVKDLGVAWATGKIDPGEHLWDDAIRGLSLGNIQDPLGLIEKISGKPGLKKRIESRQVREIEAATGKKAAQYKEAIGLGEKAASALGSMITFTPVLQGASIPARAISSIPAVQAAVRAGIMGIFTGIASKPEDDSAWNRLKQVPKEVLIWGGLEAGFVTASEIAKIINYNIRVPKGMRGRWGRWETIPPLEPKIPGKVMVKEFTPEEILDIKRTMDTNVAGTTKTKFTPHQQQAIDYFSKTNGPGWRAYKEGFKTQSVEVSGKPAVYPTATYAEVPPMPKQPKFSDLFRKGPLPQFEETFNAKWPEPGEVPKMAPEVPGAPPPAGGGSGMAPKAAPARPEAPLGPIAGEIPSPERPPQVVLDISPKPEGGWTYTFKPSVVEPILPKALQFLSPEEIKELPPHIQEIIKKSFPAGWKPTARRTFRDPLLDSIFRSGGIKPNRDFPMEVLKDLNLPVGLIKNTGMAMDVLAQELVHEYPELDNPRKSQDENLYDLILGRTIRARHGIPEERISPMTGETIGEFQGPGYQGTDREAVKEEYRKWLESQGVEPVAIKKQLALFGGEFAPPEEPAKVLKAKPIEEPVLIEIPKRDKSIFDSRGLGTFKDINVWRKQVQPFVDQGYLVEYGHEAGAKGWARLAGNLGPGKGRLIPKAKPVEGLPKPPTEMEGILEYERRFGEERRVAPKLSPKELEDIVGYERRFSERRGTAPEKVKEITKAEPEKLTDFNLRRQLAAIMPKLGIPREKWGEVSRRVLENYKPEEGELENYIRRTTTYLTPEGEPLPRAGEPKEIPIEKIPEPGEKEPAYDRFEKKEQEARIRNVVTKEAHDEADLDILESRIFSDPPESFEVIGTRHGISRQTVDKRWQALVEKLKQNPDLLEILNKKYELHSFPGIISKKNIEDLRDLIKKYFSSSKGVSKEVDAVNDERVGGILAERFGATVEAKKLDKYIKEQGSNPAVLQYFKDLLEGGNIQGASLPADIKQNLLSMRQRIDRLSDMIIANGGVPDKTKAVFEDNIGKYLGKFYRIYEMIGRAKGKMIKRYWDPPEPVRNKFKNALKQQFPQTFGTYSDEELDNFLEGMVRKTDLYARGAKRTKRIPPEHYIHRIKLTPEYREFAGEIVDPRYLYLKTVSEQAVMGYNSKMLKLIKDTYPDLWTKDLDKARHLGWQKSQLPEDWHAYGEMAGLYVNPELGEYLRNEFFPSRSGMEHAIEKYIINPFKWTKTIGSVPTHARNFLGNPMFSMLLRNSIWNPANARFYVKAAKIIVGRQGKYAKEWEGLIRHGVTETQFWGAEIPRFYEELLRIDPADWPEKFLDAGVKRPINKLSNFYNSEDTIYRIAAHLKNLEHFKMTPAESVEEQNLGMTNYRKLPTVVEILRRYPVLGPFVSFKANVVKILYNQAKQAAKDMAKKETRSKGIRRGFILASALALPIVLQEVSKKVFHIESEDQKIIEKYMPEWRRHGIYFYWRNNRGVAKVFDFTYIFPAGDIQKAARAALAGDISSFKDAINLFAHPILDLYSILVQDRDPTWGTKIPGGFKEQIAKALVQVWLPASAPIPSLKALVHGEIRAGSLTPYQIKTLIDSWYGEAPIGKEPKKFTEELKNFLTGVRTFDLNPEQIMRTYLRSKRFDLTESMNEYRTWLKQNPGARDYEVKNKLKALQEKQKKIAEALKQASEDIIKLRRGGFALEPEK